MWLSDEQIEVNRILRTTHKKIFNDTLAKLDKAPRWGYDKGEKMPFDATSSYGHGAFPAQIPTKLQKGDVIFYGSHLARVNSSGPKQTILAMNDGNKFFSRGSANPTEHIKEAAILIPADKVEAVWEAITSFYHEFVGDCYWFAFQVWYCLALACHVREIIEA